LIQRVRLPRESIEQKSANCIDGSVLMASLLEATGIEAVIVIVPKHAYLGFRPVRLRPLEYEYVETTMIGTKSFDEATAAGAAHTAKWSALGQLMHIDVTKQREAGITPID
jgi:hypothetical protein